MGSTSDISMAEPTIKEVIQRLEEIEKRLTVNEDIEQIKQLQIRYLTAHTSNDGTNEAEGLADDATCLIGTRPGSTSRYERKGAIADDRKISYTVATRRHSPLLGGGRFGVDR